MSRVKGKSTLPEAPQRWKCEECDHVSETYLTGEHPFVDRETVIGCENCMSVESLVAACWKCDKTAGIGTPHCKEYRYIHICGEHNPKHD